ncbi:hypothetical protein RhiirA1_460450 [Rhizophagus irregularis]|uniref:Uncharacterized protein n=1 Tax=Rhizophagus irregularis TaxID=588596 RepID=A0A2N0RRF9_9GLOM|nr:hypothetical protein RhiirA1_460450 [Rhizophagus irregularis]
MQKNIEIQVIICFGKWFYEKIMFFLISKNITLMQESLQNRFRARIHDPDFAVAIFKIKLINEYIKYIAYEPTNLQAKYIDKLINNLNTEKEESFGLFQILENNEFQEQFLAFLQFTFDKLSDYLLIYEFVKHRIWPIIIHQQHLEGIFNKYHIFPILSTSRN